MDRHAIAMATCGVCLCLGGVGLDRRALGRDALMKTHQTRRPIDHSRLFSHREAPGLELHEQVVVGAPQGLISGQGHFTQTVGKKTQWPVGGDA